MNEDTETDDGENHRVSHLVAAAMAAGSVVSVVGFVFMADLRLILLGIGIVFAAFAGQAALDQYRFGAG